MNDNDIKRNIIVSVVGLVSILSLLLFEISLVGSAINFYLLLIMGLGLILFIVLLIGALKEKQKKKKLIQELDDELNKDKQNQKSKGIKKFHNRRC